MGSGASLGPWESGRRVQRNEGIERGTRGLERSFWERSWEFLGRDPGMGRGGERIGILGYGDFWGVGVPGKAGVLGVLWSQVSRF